MLDAEHDAYEQTVWERAAAHGVEAGPVVRDAYRSMLLALAEAGAGPEVAARFVAREVRVALDQYSVLVETLELVADALKLTVDVSNGEGNDPVTLGHSLVKQQAGLAILHDQLANLAPYAGIGEGWDRDATAAARAAAIAERDGFLASIEALADQTLAAGSL